MKNSGAKQVVELATDLDSGPDSVGEGRSFAAGHGLATAGDGGRMVAVASQLRVRAVSLAAKTKRHRDRNPKAVFIDIAFYLVYGLLMLRLALGVISGASDDGFGYPVGGEPSSAALVLWVVLAMAAFMILHRIVNRVRLTRRFHKSPMPRIWVGRLL